MLENNCCHGVKTVMPRQDLSFPKISIHYIIHTMKRFCYGCECIHPKCVIVNMIYSLQLLCLVCPHASILSLHVEFSLIHDNQLWHM